MSNISKTLLRKVLPVGVAMAALSGTAVLAAGNDFSIKGGDGGGAVLNCPNGMVRLGHVFDETASVFPGDPAPIITIVATIPVLGFLVEQVTTGTHTGTHIDAPGHFIAGGRTIDDLAATDFVWPAYVIDVQARIAAPGADDFQLSIADIKQYEQQNGKIAKGSMVVLRTGFDAKFRTTAFNDPAPGFSGAAVQWMVDKRNIDGVGSDTFGPDATSDALFDATYTILNNNRLALPGLNNLASLQVKGDIIMAPAVALKDGSGYQVDPLGCLGKVQRNDNDNDYHQGGND
jgi:kynurenine formamidase